MDWNLQSAGWRAEAHLWLLVEDVLRSVVRGGLEGWEGRRVFGSTVDALVEVGSLSDPVGQALVAEFDDVLAARQLLPAGAFTGARWPDAVERGAGPEPAMAPPADAGAVWVEADIERHLQLVAAFPEAERTRGSAELLRIVGGPARAFDAVGLKGGLDLVDELEATLAEAGLTTGGSEVAAPPRPEWGGYLAESSAGADGEFAALGSAEVRADLGDLGDGWSVAVRGVTWSEDALQVDIALWAASVGPVGPDTASWHLRALDAQGRLHLASPVMAGHRRSVSFVLRPGITSETTTLDVRVSHRGRRVGGRVSW